MSTSVPVATCRICLVDGGASLECEYDIVGSETCGRRA